MAINADFPMLTSEQTNPWLAGLGISQDLLAKALANRQSGLTNQILGTHAKFAEPTAIQELLKSQLANQQEQVKAKYAEPTAQQALQKSILENKFYAPNMQSQIGLNNANANELRTMQQNPLLRGQSTRDLAALIMAGLVDPNQIQQMVRGLVEKPQIDIGYKEALTKTMNANTQGKPFFMAPADTKAAMIGQAKAFGVNEDDAVRAFSSGMSLSDLAAKQGYSPDGNDWPIPAFNPTSSIRTQQERANIAYAGIRAIEPSIKEALAPYVKKWNGQSLQQLNDALKGQNVERRGKALGAAAMAQELQMLRIRAGGAQVGITALKEGLEASKTRLHTPDLTMTPEVFEIAQDYISDQIGKLNSAENKALNPRGSAKNKKSYKDPKLMTDEEIQRELEGMS